MERGFINEATCNSTFTSSRSKILAASRGFINSYMVTKLW